MEVDERHIQIAERNVGSVGSSALVASSALVVASSALVAILLACQSYSTHQILGSREIARLDEAPRLAQMPLPLGNFAQVLMHSPGLH